MPDLFVVKGGVGMYLVAGLGNPGDKYAMTRHNIGFVALDYLADFYHTKINKIKHKALMGECIIAGEKVLLAKPQTFMNLSGESLREISSFYKIPPENIIVIYDDKALAPGSVRIRKKGSDGGHNGMKSIIYQLTSDNFSRIRIGIGMPPGEGENLVGHVLGKFSNEEVKTLEKIIEKVPNILSCIIQEGADVAAGKYNVTVKSQSN